MPALPPEVLKAIEPPIRQVRRALRDLDPKELPATLHKVAATEGGRLPPPLLAKLLAELDGNEWLRQRLVEKLGDRIEPGTQAFLVRDHGWWLDLAAAAVDATRSRPPEPAGDEAAEMARKLSVAAERLERSEAERTRLDRELKELRAAKARLVDPTQAAGEFDALRDENRRLASALEHERSEREGAERRVENLRRRTPVSPGEIPAHPRPRSVGLSDPVEVGRRLDTEIAALAAGVAPHGVSEAVLPPTAVAEPVPPLRLPPGLSPDQPEAVGWLLGSASPARVIVDGYNVTFLLDKVDFHGGAARRRLIGLLGRLATRRPHRFLVVFDSRQPPGEPARVGDVEVRFASGEKADDLIVELAGTLGDLPVVVITNDRELRERVEEVGGLTLWSEALTPHLG